MQTDDPPFLVVGTKISAKFKGAFCEAKVKKVQKSVKCKVVLREAPFGTVVVDIDSVKVGECKAGAVVEVVLAASTRASGVHVQAAVQSVKDSSVYTVVFDDGDERVLRRSQLCPQSGRHFHADDNLDTMPLTNPEQFGAPVRAASAAAGNVCVSPPVATTASPPINRKVQRRTPKGQHKRIISTRSGRSSATPASGSAFPPSTSSEDDADATISTTADEPSEDDAAVETSRSLFSFGALVCVNEETASSVGAAVKDLLCRRPKWYPAMVVNPRASKLTVGKKERLVRSFKDGKFAVASVAQLEEFDTDKATSVEHASFRPAVEKALLYAQKDELPPHWDRQTLLAKRTDSDDEQQEDEDDSSSAADSDDTRRRARHSRTPRTDSTVEGDGDDEDDDGISAEKKDRFVAQLYKFQDDRGTPINKVPVLGGKDVDLYRFYRVVMKLGGYNKVCNTSGWKTVLEKLKLVGRSGATTMTVKNCYARYLLHFELQNRQLGWCIEEKAGKRERAMARGGQNTIKRKWKPPLSTTSGQSVKSEKSASSSDTSLATPAATVKGTDKEENKQLDTTNKTDTSKSVTAQKSASSSCVTAVRGSGCDSSNSTPTSTISAEAGGSTNRSSQSPSASNLFDTKWFVGQRVKAHDGMPTGSGGKRWHEARVLQIDYGGRSAVAEPSSSAAVGVLRFFIHYLGWNSKWDEWVPPARVRMITGKEAHEEPTPMKYEMGDHPSLSTATDDSAEASTADSNATPNKETLPTESLHSESNAAYERGDEDCRMSPALRKLALARKRTEAIRRRCKSRADSSSSDDDDKEEKHRKSQTPLKTTRKRTRSSSVTLAIKECADKLVPSVSNDKSDNESVNETDDLMAVKTEDDNGEEEEAVVVLTRARRKALEAADIVDHVHPPPTKVAKRTTTPTPPTASSIDLSEETAKESADFCLPTDNTTDTEPVAEGVDATVIATVDEETSLVAVATKEEEDDEADDIEIPSDSGGGMTPLHEDGDGADTCDSPSSSPQRKTSTASARGGRARRRRRNYSHMVIDRKPTKKKPPLLSNPATNDGGNSDSEGVARKDSSNSAGSPRDTFAAMKARILLQMEQQDFDYDFGFTPIDPCLKGDARISALQMRIQEIRGKYQEIRASLASLDRRWKKTQARQKKLSERGTNRCGSTNDGDTKKPTTAVV